MRRREDGDVVGRKPAPQLPEVRLDPTVLGREVVRDEQVPHSSACTNGLASSLDEREEVAPSERSARPARVRAQELVVMVEVGAQRQLDLRIMAVGGVAEDDQRVPAEVPHGPVGDVPAAVPFEQRLVRRGEQIEHVDPLRGGGLVAGDGRATMFGGHTSWHSSHP